MANALAGYTDTLDDKKIQFKQGTQADLNTMISVGNAEEGTFYLTIDTHKLYIGRKSSTVKRTDAGHTNDYKIIPEQVSRGVTVVESTTDLPTPTTPATWNPNDVPSEAIEEGELFYVTNANILAALHWDATNNRFEWKQINPPTGINAVTSTISAVQNTDNVNVNIEVATTGGSQDTNFQLIAGDNITLTPSGNGSGVTIASQNSQSNLSITESTKATNKSPVILSDGTNLDTSVYFVGAQDTATSASYAYKASTDTSVVSGKTYYTLSGTTYSAVANPTGNPSTSSYYERENIITVIGPEVQGIAADVRGTAGGTGNTHGFDLIAKVKPGGSDTVSDKELSNNGSVFDPVIDYGTNSSAYFYGGHAQLDVYTKSEADSAIDSAIESKLQVANAMTYKGLVETQAQLTDKTATGNVRQGAQIGDTYKAKAEISLTQNVPNPSNPATVTSVTTTVKPGDLLIANGVEYQNTDATAPGYTTNTSLVGTLNPDSMYWDVVPSGDEPVPVGEVSPGSSTPYFSVVDDTTDNYILKVGFDNANSSLITATGVGSDATNYQLRLSHNAVTRSDTLNSIVSATSSDTDSIGSAGIKIFALSGAVADSKASGITTSGQGHVTGVTGSLITLKHNYLDSVDISHSHTHTNGSSTYVGTINVGGTNSIGSLNTTAGNIVFESDTLKITAANDHSKLNVDLVWGSF